MNVPVGISTKIGFILAALAAITPIIGELASAAEPLGVPAQTWVIVSAVLAVATILGRMAQAVVLAGKQDV